MLETFCLSVLGSGGVAGIFFALIRHYIERRLMEVEAREQERIKYKIEQRKADEEITHATGRVLFWLHHAIMASSKKHLKIFSVQKHTKKKWTEKFWPNTALIRRNYLWNYLTF